MTRDDLKRLSELNDQQLGEMVCVHFTEHETHVGIAKANADKAARTDAAEAMAEKLAKERQEQAEAAAILQETLADLQRQLTEALAQIAAWRTWYDAASGHYDARAARLAAAKQAKEQAERELEALQG